MIFYVPQQTMLQGDINCSEMGENLHSDDDIHKDESLHALNTTNGYFVTDNGSGSSVIRIPDDDGWVIPYDELTPEEKSAAEVEDTKL